MRMTPAVLNLLIINVLCFAASFVVERGFGIDINDFLGLHYIQASNFGVWQFLTFVFMHGSLSHLFFNMFALWMFGTIIENSLGTRRFVTYYLVCGVGSGIIQQIAMAVDIAPFISAVDSTFSNLNTDSIQHFPAKYCVAFSTESHHLINTFISSYNAAVATSPAEAEALARNFLTTYQNMYVDAQCTVGASGAVFGILLAFGMMFPNMQIFLLFPPIPLKAKWMVIGYGLIELFGGVHGADYDNVAHWAHLGGMLFGFILLRLWKVRKIY